MNGLKEDALVDVPNTLTLPQLILSISLFVLLIGWLVVFAYLALRPVGEKQVEENEPTVSRPVVKLPVVHVVPVSPRKPNMHPITHPTPIVTVGADKVREVVLDHSSR